MLTLQPGEHGSTYYGGNLLVCEVVTVTFEILCDKKLSENSVERDIQLRIMKLYLQLFLFLFFFIFQAQQINNKTKTKA